MPLLTDRSDQSGARESGIAVLLYFE